MTTGVDTRQVQDGAITRPKLDVFSSKGDLLTSNGTGTIKIPRGNDREVLVSRDFASDGLEWQAQASIWELVSRQTVSVGFSSVDFTFGIDSTGDEYLITIDNMVVDTGQVSLHARLSNDGGSTYESGSSAYQWGLHGGYISGQTLNDGSGAAGEDGVQLSWNAGTPNSIGNASGEGLSGWLRFSLPSDSSNPTRGHTTVVYERPDGSLNYMTGWCKRFAVESNDAIRLYLSSGNITGGKFSLYKRKAA